MGMNRLRMKVRNDARGRSSQVERLNGRKGGDCLWLEIRVWHCSNIRESRVSLALTVFPPKPQFPHLLHRGRKLNSSKLDLIFLMSHFKSKQCRDSFTDYSKWSYTQSWILIVQVLDQSLDIYRTLCQSHVSLKLLCYQFHCCQRGRLVLHSPWRKK